MRLRGTKYRQINTLPEGALTPRKYAEANNMCSGAYVQVKYDRFVNGIGSDPLYTIRCWNGINFIIPNTAPVSIS